jgi:molybdate transport system substrate-binding protein
VGDRRATAGLVAAVAMLAAGGCGGGGDPRLTVLAATSLKQAFTGYAGAYDGAAVRLSFGGSDQLAAQIRAGARPGVLAAADEELPAALHREGLVEEPVRFARNRLVVAVPAGGGRVREFADLAEPGVRIAAGAPAVPVGAYARRAMRALPASQGAAIERNVASEEPDVAAVVGRVRSATVDAGFTYLTDVAPAGLRAIELPVKVEATYAAAVVRGSGHEAEARRFVRGLAGGRGRAALDEAGFQ